MFFFSLLSRSPYLPYFPANHKKNEKQKQKKFFPHKWVRSWLAYPESLCFQVFKFSCCFWFVVIAQGARKRAYVAEKTRTKTFPFCFWFAAIAQGARQRAYAVRENNSLRLKHKISNNKLIKYERFKKKIHHCNIIPSDLPKWVFLE